MGDSLETPLVAVFKLMTGASDGDWTGSLAAAFGSPIRANCSAKPLPFPQQFLRVSLVGGLVGKYLL